MILIESDAIYAADRFINYYSCFNRIDDYLRHVKKDRMDNRSGSLFGAVGITLGSIWGLWVVMGDPKPRSSKSADLLERAF